ncbi:hypothetical protein [Methylobacterium mesophilicum]|uniref:hypothetical protein n=1 Tax=Methylobacterium mesophilicum TaxID=39956 RepID=UPI002F35C55E
MASMVRRARHNIIKTSITSIAFFTAISADAAEVNGDNKVTLQSSSAAADPTTKRSVELPTHVLSSEEGIEIDETGVNFLPDEFGVACFTKLGRFHTDDRGIHIKYRRRAPDIYVHSEFDSKVNRYHIVFGNNFCRYTMTIQREIKISGQWKLSTMSD